MTQHAILVKHEVVLTRLPQVFDLLDKGLPVFVPMVHDGLGGCLFNHPSQFDLSQHLRRVGYSVFFADVRAYLEQVTRGSKLGVTARDTLIGAISHCKSTDLVLLN